MEHGSSPTNSLGRTPLQIAGRFAVLLDFPGFLILESTPECYGTWFESDQLPWSDTHPDRRAFVVFRDYPGSWSDSNQPPECYGMRRCPTSFPQWRHHSIWVSAEGRLIDTAIFPRLSLTVKFGFPEQRTGGYGDAIGMRIRRDEKKPVDYSKNDWKLYFLQVRKFLVNFTKEKMQAAVA